MSNVQFHILQHDDDEIIDLIAGWYLNEWKVPKEKAIGKLKTVAADSSQLQVLMKIDGIAMATGGLHHYVGLHDKEPRFAVYKNWLAMVYTIPEWRQKGHGATLCTFIQEQAALKGVKEMYLFTDTAERLYQRLGWKTFDRVAYGTRNVVLMNKEL